MTREQATAYALQGEAVVRALFDDQRASSPTSAEIVPSISDLLTERELEIVRLIAEGHTNQEIANRLFLAFSTVKWYINVIYSKLHVANRTQAVARARELNLLA